MKITVLDGKTLNPGDLSWEALGSLGDLTVYDRTEPELVVERSSDSEIILTNKTVITSGIISQLPKLKYIGVLATGYNVVDTAAASKAGIIVTNIPAYSTASVAQTAISLLLAITQRPEYYTNQNRHGRWSASPDFSYADYPLIELAGKNFGVIGFGRTGHATASIARALGMNVKVFSSKPQDQLPEWVEKMDLDDIFRHCDAVSLHAPLADDTFHIVNRERLALMKPTAIILNTARGPLVDEKALAEALNAGNIYAAGVDVLSTEPPASDNPLLSARNCFVTPHIAWATKEARIRLMEICAANVKAFLDGRPQNVVC